MKVKVGNKIRRALTGALAALLVLAAGQDHSGTLTPEQVEALTKIQALTPEDAERIRKSFCEAAAIAAQALADFAAAISQGFPIWRICLEGR